MASRYLWTILPAASVWPTYGAKRGNNMKSRANRGAGYISEMALQLAELAKSDGFELLAYLLTIAAVEATQQNKARQQAKP
jgi:hypothetical protein